MQPMGCDHSIGEGYHYLLIRGTGAIGLAMAQHLLYKQLNAVVALVGCDATTD